MFHRHNPGHIVIFGRDLQFLNLISDLDAHSLLKTPATNHSF
jgi:hypothetical protein